MVHTTARYRAYQNRQTEANGSFQFDAECDGRWNVHFTFSFTSQNDFHLSDTVDDNNLLIWVTTKHEIVEHETAHLSSH